MRNWDKEYELLDEKFFGGNNVCGTDLFAHALINGSRITQSGFEAMLSAKNYFCAIPMIRQQVDGCIIAFAYLLSKDYDKYLDTYLLGGDLNELETSWEDLGHFNFTKKMLVDNKIVSLLRPDGKPNKKALRLTNRFVYELLNLRYPGLKDIYRKCCKFVHPSSEHYKASVQLMNEGKFSMILDDWDKITPHNYSEEQMIKDMDAANEALIDLLNIFVDLREYFFQTVNGKMVNMDDASDDVKNRLQIMLDMQK